MNAGAKDRPRRRGRSLRKVARPRPACDRLGRDRATVGRWRSAASLVKDRHTGGRSLSMRPTSLRGERALVTGGAGTIGSHIVDQLIEAGASEIVVLDNFVRGRRENLAQASSSGLVRIVEGDIRDRALVQTLTQDIDVVFHQAAIRITQCAEEPRLAHEVLVDGTFNVIEAAAAAGVRKVVAASSASIYGLATRFPTTEDHHPYDNDTLYGAAKIYNEGLLRSYHAMTGLDYVALRYFNVYGPRMDVHGLYTEVLIRWMERIDEGMAPLIFGDGVADDGLRLRRGHRAREHPRGDRGGDRSRSSTSQAASRRACWSSRELLHRRDGRRSRGRVRTRARRQQGLSSPGGHQSRARRARFRGADVDRGGPRRSGRLVACGARGHTGGGCRGRVVMQVPFARPYLTGKEGEAVTKVIESGWVSQGPQVQAFEAAFARARRGRRRGCDDELHDRAAPRAVRPRASVPATR